MPCSKHEKIPLPVIAMPTATTSASAHQSPAPLIGDLVSEDRTDRDSVANWEDGVGQGELIRGESGLSETEATTWNTAQRQAAVGQLLELHFDRVYRYAYYLSSCGSVAEDIAQEVFLRAFRSIHQLRSEQSAVGWLLTIARNEFGRYCLTRKAALNIDDYAPSDETNHTRQVDCQDWVRHALEQLPIEFRSVVLMFYFEEKSYAQIAEELDLPMGTVMSRLSRGRSHLKQALEKQSEPQPLEVGVVSLVKDHQ